MALYNIIFKPSVNKDFKSIPVADIKRILKRIEALANNPRSRGCEKLTGQDEFRVKQGDYRILYKINDDELKIRVMKVGHRKDIYRVSEEKTKYVSKSKK